MTDPTQSLIPGLPTSDIGAVAGAIRSVADLVDGILTRSDREGPEKEKNENIATLQNAFAENQLDSDGFRLWIDRLLNAAGTPLTPAGDAGQGRRELLHALLLCAINLVYERKLANRAITALEKAK